MVLAEVEVGEAGCCSWLPRCLSSDSLPAGGHTLILLISCRALHLMWVLLLQEEMMFNWIERL